MRTEGAKGVTTSTTDARGRITIPVAIRSAMGLRPGDTVTFVAAENGGFVLLRGSDVVAGRGAQRKRATFGLLAERIVVPADFDMPLPTDEADDFMGPVFSPRLSDKA